jgi:hypothetical protein
MVPCSRRKSSYVSCSTSCSEASRTSVAPATSVDSTCSPANPLNDQTKTDNSASKVSRPQPCVRLQAQCPAHWSGPCFQCYPCVKGASWWTAFPPDVFTRLEVQGEPAQGLM